MHGLINRSLEAFLRDTYGAAFWAETCRAAGYDGSAFLPTKVYPNALTRHLVAAAARALAKPEPDLIEDLGAWLALFEPVRRLLRFSSPDFAGFLLALEELPDRVAMIVPGIDLPQFRITPGAPGEYLIRQRSGRALWRALLSGMVRAMADDYGALILIDAQDDELRVELLAEAFAEGRDFRLTESAGIK